MEIKSYPHKSEKPTAVALGFFDGVHTAHRKIIESAVHSAEKGLTPTVFTFKTLSKKAPSGMLSPKNQKQELFKVLGVELLVEADFDSIKNLSPESFVKDILKESLNAKIVFCGYNYRFGKNAKGDAKLLSDLCTLEGIEVFSTDKMTCDLGEISSTEIKTLLTQGKIKEANRLLRSPYSFEGTIVHGKQIGRKMGMPTLNINIPEDKFIPRLGVYAAVAKVDGITYRAAVNIGTKPTVKNDKEVNLEAHLLDVQGDFYGNFGEIFLVDFIRDEKFFDSLEDLQSTIEKDIIKIKETLNVMN